MCVCILDMLGEAEMGIIQSDIASKNESKSTIKVSVPDIRLFLVACKVNMIHVFTANSEYHIPTNSLINY